MTKVMYCGDLFQAGGEPSRQVASTADCCLFNRVCPVQLASWRLGEPDIIIQNKLLERGYPPELNFNTETIKQSTFM